MRLLWSCAIQTTNIIIRCWLGLCHFFNFLCLHRREKHLKFKLYGKINCGFFLFSKFYARMDQSKICLTMNLWVRKKQAASACTFHICTKTMLVPSTISVHNGENKLYTHTRTFSYTVINNKGKKSNSIEHQYIGCTKRTSEWVMLMWKNQNNMSIDKTHAGTHIYV